MRNQVKTAKGQTCKYDGNPDVVKPFDLKEGKATHKLGSQMAKKAWASRASEPKMQWMKFMAAFDGNGKQIKEDRQLMSFSGQALSMDWFFGGAPGNGRNSFYEGGGMKCVQFPSASRIAMEINDVDVGSTNHAVGYGNSMGLANRDNDACSSSNNIIHAREKAGEHKFIRLDGSSQDNSIRHLVSYQDAGNGISASRCSYCCWGCGGTMEIVMWGVRAA